MQDKSDATRDLAGTLRTMKDHADYYDILHVRPDAPTEIIKSSYRTLMQRLKQHPDLGGDHEHAARINKAYATLSDSGSRAAYDRQRHVAAAASSRSTELRSDQSEPQAVDGIENPCRPPIPGCCVFPAGERSCLRIRAAAPTRPWRIAPTPPTLP